MAEQTYRFYIRQGEFELDLEGDQEFVESYLEAFFEGEAAAFPDKISPALTAGSKKKDKGPVASKPGSLTVDAARLADFLKSHRPKTNKGRILCYLLFLLQNGVKEWGMPQLEACFTAQGKPFPASGRQYFQIFKKAGLVEKGSGWGLWKFTAAGLREAENSGKGTAAPKRVQAKKAASKKKAPPRKAKKAVAKKAPAKATKKAAPKRKGAKKPRKETPAAAPTPAPEV